MSDNQRISAIVGLLADRAEELKADPNDSAGLVRQLVTANGLGFYTWFSVCCELAERAARRGNLTQRFGIQ
jgi:hypothetical protein